MGDVWKKDGTSRVTFDMNSEPSGVGDERVGSQRKKKVRRHELSGFVVT